MGWSAPTRPCSITARTIRRTWPQISPRRSNAGDPPAGAPATCRRGLVARAPAGGSPALLMLPRAARLQHLQEFLGRDGEAEVIALYFAAVVFLQELELRLRLHPLGHHAQVQSLGQLDHRADDRRVLHPLRQILHEIAIDLQRVDGELLQVAQ